MLHLGFDETLAQHEKDTPLFPALRTATKEYPTTDSGENLTSGWATTKS